MPRTRTLLVVALTIISGSLVAACGGEANKGLETCNGPGYSVLMPGKPKKKVEKVQTAAGPIEVVAYVSDSSNRAFAVARTTLPSGVKGDLDGAVQGAATNIGGTVKSVKKTTYQGFPARDSRTTGAKDSKGNPGTVFARFILTDDSLIQLQFVTEGADVQTPDADYTKFVDSLKIQ